MYVHAHWFPIKCSINDNLEKYFFANGTHLYALKRVTAKWIMHIDKSTTSWCFYCTDLIVSRELQDFCIKLFCLKDHLVWCVHIPRTNTMYYTFNFSFTVYFVFPKLLAWYNDIYSEITTNFIVVVMVNEILLIYQLTESWGLTKFIINERKTSIISLKI